ncbi:hypothetical protein ACN47E_010259 [Coniothyrium glycines]
MPPAASLLPKALIAIFCLAIFYQLTTFTSVSHFAAPVPTSLGDNNEQTWFQDAAEKPGAKDDEDNSPTGTSTTGALSDTSYKEIHISYGPTQCMPHFSPELKKLAAQRKDSCTKYAPFPAIETRRVAFASITTGKPEEAYQRAILSQMFHSAVHDSPIHVLCEQLTDGTFNKIAFLLNLLMKEMLKPESQRTEWFMWIDRDAIVLDACRPISMFLPPATEEYSKVNIIQNHDAFGLNNGIFLFRVNHWTIAFMNTILAFPYYRPEVELVQAEQTAQQEISMEDKWREGVVQVPWYWFNAFPDEKDSVRKYEEGLEPDDLEWFRARKGDFVVHFAGDHGRGERMLEWLDMQDRLGNVWEQGNVKRDITAEIEKFWRSWKDNSLTDVQITGEPQRS